MRRKAFFALMTGLGLLFLCACSESGDSERAGAFMKSLEGKSISVTARVCAEADETRTEFKLGCVQTQDGFEVTVQEPGEIAGVKASVSENGAKIQYEDVVLSTGEKSGRMPSPVSALPILSQALQSGWISQVWREELGEIPCLAARIVRDGETSVTVWMKYDTLLPIYAEIISGESVCVSCEILEWNENT